MMMSSSMRQPSLELSHFEQNHDESFSASNLDIKRRSSKSIVRDSFKCGMACLYMPGFYKRKSMLPLPRSAQQTPESTVVAGTAGISMALSLERTECSSSSSGNALSKQCYLLVFMFVHIITLLLVATFLYIYN